MLVVHAVLSACVPCVMFGNGDVAAVQRPADHAEGLCPCVFVFLGFFLLTVFFCYFPQHDLVVGFHSPSLLLYLV